MNEEYRPIKDYPTYIVSNKGNVISLYTSRRTTQLILKKVIVKGYEKVLLYNENGRKAKSVHRLVAEAFLPNPNNLPIPNHLDGNKSNNNIKNLEWTDESGNTLHAYRELGKKNSQLGKIGRDSFHSRPVLQLSLTGEVIKEWDGARDAGRAGFNHCNISAVCNGREKTHRGFKWSFKK